MAPRKKKKGRAGPARKAPNHRFKVLLAALFLSGFLIVSLVLLSSLRNAHGPTPAPPVSGTNLEILGDIRGELESVLLQRGATLQAVETYGAGELRMEAEGEFPPPEVVSDMDRRMRRISGDLRLEARPASGTIHISGEGIAVVLGFHRPVAEPAPEEKPKVVIIMDDLGADLAFSRALLEIDLPVTFAILPGTANAARVATLAHRRGREVMVHIPMEPLDFPGTNPGRDALLVEHSEDEIRRRVQGYLDRIPYVVGGNNHMGSRFTEDRKKMGTVLEEMKDAGLFFVDSLTSGRSVAFEEARRAGLPSARRDVFLDNVQDVDQISREIRRLAVVAKRKGSAVGICHPYPQTLEALRRATGYLKDQGIEIVPASEVLIR